MREANCYCCGSVDHRLYASENGFNLVKCTQCGLLYASPRPRNEEIDEATKIGAHRGDRTLDSTGRYMPVKVAMYRKVLKDIFGNELRQRQRVWLDVGCGHGELLVALQEVASGNIDSTGLEPNEYKIAAARKRRLKIEYFDLASHRERYDVISLLNVYSHLPSPPDFIRIVRERLNPGGELLLQTGDTADLAPDEHPRPFLLPDHLSFASAHIVASILEALGFKIVSIHKYPALRLGLMKGRILREILKLILPNKKSQLRALYSSFRARQYRTDMWIRARLGG